MLPAEFPSLLAVPVLELVMSRLEVHRVNDFGYRDILLSPVSVSLTCSSSRESYLVGVVHIELRSVEAVRAAESLVGMLFASILSSPPWSWAGSRM